MPKLSDLKVKTAKPTEKPYKLYDEDGLYLLVSPLANNSCSKLWRMKYRYDKKEKSLSCGIYPEVSLSQARKTVEDARKQLAQGIDPMQQRKKEVLEGKNFESVATDWIDTKGRKWREKYRALQQRRLEYYIYPRFKEKGIASITRRDILDLVKGLEKSGKHETAHRVMGILTAIFNYAAKMEIIELSPCFGLEEVLAPVISTPRAAIVDPKGAGALMRSIYDYQGSFVVRMALKFSALTFCRPGEIRSAEWEEIDFKKKIWAIPASKTKMDKPHIVPLARQCLQLLEELKEVTGHGKYLFPSIRSRERPITDVTVLAALRQMGYEKERMSAHGFRSMASTLLNEQGCKHDVIEAQLAHEGYDKIRAIYNRAEYMEERRQLMQKWADYLDELREKQQDH